jgi:hypothetical protein
MSRWRCQSQAKTSRLRKSKHKVTKYEHFQKFQPPSEQRFIPILFIDCALELILGWIEERNPTLDITDITFLCFFVSSVFPLKNAADEKFMLGKAGKHLTKNDI